MVQTQSKNTSYYIPLWYSNSPTSGLPDLPRIQDLDVDSPAGEFFIVSENSIILCDMCGIRLYHIPELGSVDDSSSISPVWSWSGVSTYYAGSLYDTGSQNTKLYIQGSLVTHKLEFGPDKSGFLVVLKHSITEERPAYYIPCEQRGIILKGRKGVRHHRDGCPVIVFNTLLLGKEHTPGVFRIRTDELSGEDYLPMQEVKHLDLDEVTGRLLIGVDFAYRDSGIHAQRLLLMDPLA
jgi:hypothetical protein